MVLEIVSYFCDVSTITDPIKSIDLQQPSGELCDSNTELRKFWPGLNCLLYEVPVSLLLLSSPVSRLTQIWYIWHLTLKWISSRKRYQDQTDPVWCLTPASTCVVWIQMWLWTRCWGHTHRYVVGVDVVWTFVVVHRHQLHPAEVVWRESRQKLKQSASRRKFRRWKSDSEWNLTTALTVSTTHNMKHQMLIMFLNTERHPWCFAASDSQGRMLVYLFLGLLTGRSAASWERSRPTLFSSWKTPTSVKHLQDS